MKYDLKTSKYTPYYDKDKDSIFAHILVYDNGVPIISKEIKMNRVSQNFKDFLNKYPEVDLNKILKKEFMENKMFFSFTLNSPDLSLLSPITRCLYNESLDNKNCFIVKDRYFSSKENKELAIMDLKDDIKKCGLNNLVKIDGDNISFSPDIKYFINNDYDAENEFYKQVVNKYLPYVRDPAMFFEEDDGKIKFGYIDEKYLDLKREGRINSRNLDKYLSEDFDISLTFNNYEELFYTHIKKYLEDDLENNKNLVNKDFEYDFPLSLSELQTLYDRGEIFSDDIKNRDESKIVNMVAKPFAFKYFYDEAIKELTGFYPEQIFSDLKQKDLQKANKFAIKNTENYLKYAPVTVKLNDCIKSCNGESLKETIGVTATTEKTKKNFNSLSNSNDGFDDEFER